MYLCAKKCPYKVSAGPVKNDQCGHCCCCHSKRMEARANNPLACTAMLQVASLATLKAANNQLDYLVPTAANAQLLLPLLPPHTERANWITCQAPNNQIVCTVVLQVASQATVDPQDSEQTAIRQFTTGTVNFIGCNSPSVIPTVSFNDFKILNYTFYTWSATKAMQNSSGKAVATTIVTTESNSKGPAWAAKLKADFPASLVVENAKDGLMVSSPRGTHKVGVSIGITRGAGQTGLLYGIEGQLAVGSPTKKPMVATSVQIAIVKDGDSTPTVIVASCPAASQKAAGLTLPAAQGSVVCSFRYNTTDPTPGAVTGGVVLGSKSYLGPTSPFAFGSDSGLKVSPKTIGNCAVATDMLGMEAAQPADLLIPLVRERSRSRVALPEQSAGE